MSSFALTGATCYVAGYDFSGDSNQMALNLEMDELDNTTFGSGGYRSRTGGVRSIEASLSGFWQSDTTDAVDPQVFSNLGTMDEVVTISPTGTAGEAAYFFQGGKFSYSMGGDLGEVMPYDLSMMGSNGVGAVRGLIGKAKGDVSATGALGSGLNLGAVDASQYLYAAFHVFSAGTTITVKIESDDNSNFTSATDRITFSAITTAGGTWATRLAGAITDTYYRFNVTAITGTFNVAGSIGIG